MALKEVCRLCLASEELVWVFDKRFETSNSMKDVVYITTGVEITLKDIISQKICKKCCQVTIKMFEFRRTSLKNDQHLKDQCKLILKQKELKIPNTQVTIRSDTKKNNILDKKTDTNKVASEAKPDPKPSMKIHPSVRELFEVYPQIKVPTSCLKYDISPSVTMQMDLVEQYFKARKMDIQSHTKLAVRAGKVATKRTYPAKTKNVTPPKVDAPSKIVKNSRVKPSKVEEVNPSPVIDRTSGRTSDVNDAVITRDEEVPVKDDASQLPPPTNKRKHPESEIPEKKEIKKTNFIESLGLTPKTDEATPTGGPSFITNKTQPVHICEICNSVQYSSKDLRKHKNKHLRCQFCKLKFRTLEGKKEHLDKSCPIKNMMNRLPKVKLERVDSNEWVRSRYPEAFQEFPNSNTPINNNENMPSEEENIPKPVAQPQSCEVIEILSDEDEDAPLSTSKNSAQAEVQVPPSVKQTDMMVDYTMLGPASSSIVRPDIKIKGNTALDLIDARLTDIKVLKELLTLYRPVQIYVDSGVQTIVPTNDTISINSADMTAELKLLKPQLHVFKIPVVMKTGSFGVCYNFVSEQKPPKKLCLWNDLTAVDIKPTNIKVVPRQNSTTLITVCNNSLNLANRSQQSLTPTTSKFIRVNANALSPITTGLYTQPSANLIDTNPMLNNFLQKVTSTTTVATITQSTTPVATIALTTTPVATVAQTTTPVATIAQTTTATEPTVVVDEEASNAEASGPQFGIIRVKNVWELT